MSTTVNDDGSITTTFDDAEPAKETKVVTPSEKPAARSKSQAESK